MIWWLLLPEAFALGYFGTGAVYEFMNKRGLNKSEVQV